MRSASLAFAALASALWAGAALAAPPLEVGAPAPALVGETLDGRPFDLAALKGRVVVLNLWATWCPPCRAEMPTLDAYARAHPIVMIGVSADRPRDVEDVHRAMRGVSYPALMLRRAQRSGLGLPTALPETIVIDATGTVRAALAHPVSAAELDAVVGPLLAAQSPASLAVQ